MGAEETLNPSLVGLWNMAVTFLPKSYKLINIVSATREVVAGVRYNLLVNAQNENFTETLCDIEILEKPWILSEWGDKLRTLQYTNCTYDSTKIKSNEEDDDKTRNYNFNPMFSNKYNDITDEMLKALEEQIIKPKAKLTTTTTTTKPNLDPILSALEAQILKSQQKISTTTIKNLLNFEHLRNNSENKIDSKNINKSDMSNDDNWLKNLEQQIWQPKLTTKINLDESVKPLNNVSSNKDSLEQEILHVEPVTTIITTTLPATANLYYELTTNSQNSSESVQDGIDEVFVFNNNNDFEMEPKINNNESVQGSIEDYSKSTTETISSDGSLKEFSTTESATFDTRSESNKFKLDSGIIKPKTNSDKISSMADIHSSDKTPPKNVDFYEFFPNIHNVYDESDFHKTIDDLVGNLVKELMIPPNNNSSDNQNNENKYSSSDNAKNNNNMFRFYEFNPSVENEYETLQKDMDHSKITADDAISKLFKELANVEKEFSKGIYDLIYLEINVKENPIYVPVVDGSNTKINVKHNALNRKLSRHSRESSSSSKSSSESIENSISNKKQLSKESKDSNEGGEIIEENKVKIKSQSSSSESNETYKTNVPHKKISDFEKIFVINFMNRLTDLSELESIASDMLPFESNLSDNNVLYVLKIKSKNFTDCSIYDNGIDESKYNCSNKLLVDTTKICNIQVKHIKI